MVPPRGRAAARWLLALIYLLAGAAHLLRPAMFVAIVPPGVPMPATVVLVTGICELFGGIGLLLSRWRRLAGMMLAIYAIAVFPANLYHAFGGVAPGGVELGWSYHVPRLLFQPVLVWWALFAGGLVDWPWRQS